MGLRWRIALALTVVAVTATVAVGVIGYRTTSQRLLDGVDRSISEAAALLPSRGNTIGVPARGPLAVYSVRVLLGDGSVGGSSFDVDVPVADDALDVIGEPRAVHRGTVSADGTPYRVHTIGLPNGAVQVARSLEETEQVLDDVRRRTVLLVVVVALAAATSGWLIAATVAAPLRRLTRAAEDVQASGELDVDVPIGGSDEVGRLGSAFRGMLDALARSRAEQRRLVQDAGHELRTPLTSLRTNLAVLRRHADLPDETRRQILDDLEGEVDELTQLVDEVVAAASGVWSDQPDEELRLGDVAEAVAERVGRRRGREIRVQRRSEATVSAPPAAIERAIANLVDNACKFDASGEVVEVVVDGGALTVLDRGPGVPGDELPFIFDRFHRADSARQLPGSGLGLAIVRDVVTAGGGTVHAANRDDGGAAIGFRLPTLDSPPTPSPLPPPPQPLR